MIIMADTYVENMTINVQVNNQDAEKKLEKTRKSIGNTSRAAYSATLSLMFMGYALQRISKQVMDFGTKAYDEISHSVVGTITATDRLNGAMQFLGFSIGEALQPVIEFLVPIIEVISNWVEENQGLTTTFLVLAATIGTAFSVGGSAMMALSGMQKLLSEIGINASKMQIASVGVGLVYAGMSYSEFSNGEIFKGVTDALISAGFMAIAGGKQSIGKAAIGVGVALSFIELLAEGQPFNKDKMAAWLAKNSAGLFFVSPGVGAAALTMSIALELLPNKITNQIADVMGILVGGIMVIIGAAIDVITFSIEHVVNGLIAIYDMISGESVGPVSLRTNLSGGFYSGIQSLASDLRGENTNKTFQNTVPSTINNYYIQNQTVNNPSDLASLLKTTTEQSKLYSPRTSFG